MRSTNPLFIENRHRAICNSANELANYPQLVSCILRRCVSYLEIMCLVILALFGVLCTLVIKLHTYRGREKLHSLYYGYVFAETT